MYRLLSVYIALILFSSLKLRSYTFSTNFQLISWLGFLIFSGLYVVSLKGLLNVQFIYFSLDLITYILISGTFWVKILYRSPYYSKEIQQYKYNYMLYTMYSLDNEISYALVCPALSSKTLHTQQKGNLISLTRTPSGVCIMSSGHTSSVMRPFGSTVTRPRPQFLPDSGVLSRLGI